MTQPTVAAIVITYNPGPLGPLLETLAAQCARTLVVDNGSRELAPIEAACAAANAARNANAELGDLPSAIARPSVELIPLGENLGIAAAQNRGIERARALGATHVLLMDHDSLPANDMVALLLAALDADPDLAAAGPLAAENRKGTNELVYVARAWKPGRATTAELDAAKASPAGTLDAAFLIASGCLIRAEALEEIGPMREELFIDHVDLDWGLRARNAGWRLAAVPAARLTHSLGDEAVLLPGRAQPVHVHGPVRNYYLARNTLWLVRQPGLAPARWRVRYVWWLAKYTGFNALLAGGLPFSRASVPTPEVPDSRRRTRIRLLARGLRDGLRGRMGRLG